MARIERRCPERFRTASRLHAVTLLIGILTAESAIPEELSFTQPGVDWSLGARLGTRIGVDVNRNLDPDEERDTLLRTALDAGLILDAETKRALLTIDAGLAAEFFAGDNPPRENRDSLDPTRLDPSAAARYTYRGKAYTFTGNLGFEVRAATEAQADDTGLVDDNASQINVRYGADLVLLLSETDQLSIGTSGGLIDFFNESLFSDLVATRTFDLARIGWQRQLTETSTIGVSAGLRQFAADNVDETRSQTVDLVLSLDHRRTPRHNFGLSGGVNFVRTTRQLLGPGKETDFDVAGLASASLDYTSSAFRAGFGLSQSVDPSSEGELASFTRVDADLGYDVNELQNLDLIFSYSYRAPISGDQETRHFLTIGPTYSFILSPETRLSLNYRFRASREEIDGIATGHQLFLTLTRDFALSD